MKNEATTMMRLLLERLAERVKEKSLYTGNMIGGLMGELECLKHGYSLERVTRSSGSADLAMKAKDGVEVKPFWDLFYRTYDRALSTVPAELARHITEDLAYDAMKRLVSYGLTPEESALVLSSDRMIYHMESNSLNGGMPNQMQYVADLITIATESDEAHDLGMVDLFVDAMAE